MIDSDFDIHQKIKGDPNFCSLFAP